MGYQESYVTAPNFEALIEVTNGLGKPYFEQRHVEPVLIITLNEDVEVTKFGRLKSDKFKKGTRFIYFVGERQYQRSISLLYDRNLPKDTDIWATEDFPSEAIFADGSTFATLEGFKI